MEFVNLHFGRPVLWHLLCGDKGKCISSLYSQSKIWIILSLPFKKGSMSSLIRSETVHNNGWEDLSNRIPQHLSCTWTTSLRGVGSSNNLANFKSRNDRRRAPVSEQTWQTVSFYFHQHLTKSLMRAVPDSEIPYLAMQHFLEEVVHMFRNKITRFNRVEKDFAPWVAFSQLCLDNMSSDYGFLRWVRFSVNVSFTDQDLQTLRTIVFRA